MYVAAVGEELIKALTRGDENAATANDGVVVKAVALGELGIAVEDGIKLGISCSPYLAAIGDLAEVVKVFGIA